MVFSLFPIENFPNVVIATIFSILFVLVLFFELKLLKKFKQKTIKKEDKNSFLVLISTVLFLLFTMIILSLSRIGRINTKTSYFGVLILIIGFLLRQYSIKTLGNFFTPFVSIQKNQKIIQTGAYKYIRHHSYTGLLLEFVGGALALSNLISFLAVFIFLIQAIEYRIKIEESFLLKNFKAYKRYMQKTKKLIPFVY